MDPRLVKYATADVPRYTSYPTAVQFQNDFPHETWKGWLAALPEDATLSVYIHVPFCRQMCWYCGCHTSVPNTYDRAARYVERLLKEIDITAPLLSVRKGQVTHFHFGGGTPTYLTEEDLARIVEHVRARFGLADGAEVAIEMDPRTFSAEKAKALADMGFNRGSFGVQDFNERVQRLVNRIQPYEMVAQCVQDLRNAGIEAVNFDLMYGLPGQTVDSVVETARQAAGLRPDRIAVFGYAHVPWFKKHQKMIRDEDLPDIDARYEQARAIERTLIEEGYTPIGLDHYAREGDPMIAALENGTLRRNFQGYTVDPADALLGFGCSAISSMPQGYAQAARDMARWATAIEEGRLTIDRGLTYTPEDRMRGEIIEKLMCFLRVRPAEIVARHGFPEESIADAWEKLRPLAADGLCEITADGEVIVPDEHRLFVRTVASAFDAHYRPAPNRHAKAV